MLQTAIILAGGFGTRLQPVVSDLPKPMAEVNGRPFLDYQLNYLKHYGIKEIIFSLGHLAHKIKEQYQTHFNGMKITYVVEKDALGTGGGIRLAIKRCEEDQVWVLNGDSFFDVDLHDYYKQHVNGNSQVSLALREVSDAARYGTIETNIENRITVFKEKNLIHQAGIINAGIYILNKKIYLESTPANKKFSIEKDFFETRLKQISINGYLFKGYFIDIGIPEDFQKAQNDFKGFKY